LASAAAAPVSRSAMATRAPSVEKRCTIAFPIPLPPPVTMATLFASIMLENYGSSTGSVLLPKRDIARRARPAGAHTTEQLRVNFEVVPKISRVLGSGGCP